jgi:hypothetical protein
MKSSPPPISIPRLECDFNAQGLSGESGDDCYYGLDRQRLATLHPVVGMRVFVWDWSDSELVIGCEASLEPFHDFWRARPVPDTWYEGLPDETFVT